MTLARLSDLLSNLPQAGYIILGAVVIYFLAGITLSFFILRKKKKKVSRAPVADSQLELPLSQVEGSNPPKQSLPTDKSTPGLEAEKREARGETAGKPKAESPGPTPVQPAQHKNEQKKIAAVQPGRKTLSLHNHGMVSYHDFHDKLRDVLENKSSYYRFLLPAFSLDQQNKLRIIWPKAREYAELDELYRYWRAGYRHGELAVLLMFYFAVNKAEKWQQRVLTLYAYYDINNKDRKVARLFFHEITGEKADLVDYETASLKPEFRQNGLLFSLEMANQNSISRHQFKKWKEKLIFENHIFDSAPLLVQAYLPSLLRKGTRLFFKWLVKKHLLLLGETGREYFIRNALKYGKFKRLLQLDENRAIFLLLNHPSEQAQKSPHLDHLKAFLENQPGPWGKFAWFYFCFHSRISPGEDFELGPVDIENQENFFTRFIYFLYLARIEDYDGLKNYYGHLRKRQNEYLARFYLARAHFKTGEKEQAFEIVYSLWQDEPANLAVMNEAAIYAHATGKRQQAEEIFIRMKQQYPEHPATLHNEAIFFQEQAQAEIEKRWQRYEEASQATS